MTVAEEGAPGALADTDTADAESVVVDIAGLDLEDVAALPDSVLGALLRRIHDSCAAGDPFVTGHRESQ
ncbi:FxSxx-COOH cyclophane-containing RiPP peptide [Streptomyces sp. NPDC057011]|uniref:FxSxx-COOH cyclophane-containing RiPP peptide n=1 Tax=unclassified Streptomyces TaxID=2593676 RepID=UPI00362EA565